MKRLLIWLAVCSLAVLSVAVALHAVPAHQALLLVHADDWLVVQGFRTVKVQPQDLVAEYREPVCWQLMVKEGDGSGALVSRPFKAPEWVSLLVRGDLTRQENRVFFRRMGSDEHHPVRVETGGTYWRSVTCRLPPEWVGQPVQLIASAGPRGPDASPFGVSNLRVIDYGTVLRSQLRALAVLPAFVVSLLVFLVPGLPAALWLVDRSWVRPGLIVPLAVLAGCLLGYLAFWVFLFIPAAGRALAWSLVPAAAGGLVLLFRRSPTARALIRSHEVLLPTALMACTGLFYLSLTYSVDLPAPVPFQPRLRFLEAPLAIDDEIPLMFAHQVYYGRDPRELVPPWHSSDRPPLQTGILLLQIPLALAAGVSPQVLNVALGCALQSTWVVALWVLWQTVGLPRCRAGLALLLVTLCGFAMINTVFTWPKLLSGALAVFAILQVLSRRGPGDSPMTLLAAVVLGASAGLAALAHTGVAFTLLPLALLLLLPGYYPGLSRLLAGGVTFAALVLPWGLYQTYYDPPGNRLAKEHLAGVGYDDSAPDGGIQDNRSLWQAVVENYQALGPGRAFENKVENVKVLFAGREDMLRWQGQLRPQERPQGVLDFRALRQREFHILFWGLGLLNLGWLVALRGLWKREKSSEDVPLVVPLLGLASVGCWVVLMFGPGTAIIHHGPYVAFLLLLAFLAASLSSLPTWLSSTLLALQGLAFTVVWLATSPANDYGPPNVFMIGLAVVFFLALARVAVGPALTAGLIPGRAAAKVSLGKAPAA